MIEGADDLMLDDSPFWAARIMRGLLAVLFVGLAILAALVGIGIWSAAHAQLAGALNNCSQSVGATAAAVTFPTSGATGPPAPTVYLQICNAHASNTLGVNVVGGTAAIGSSGTLTLLPGGCLWRDTNPVPVAVSVIGSAGSTVTACSYK